MRANPSPDPGLKFLFLCMTHSDMTKINYEAVAAATGLKLPTVRMRYSRLKKQIEGGMANGTSAEGAGPGAGAGEFNEQEQEQGDGGAAEAASPAKKRRVAQKTPGATKGKKTKGNDKGKGKGAQLDSEGEDGEAGFVKEEMSDA